MIKKFGRLLFELSKNARLSTKKLGQLMRVSQQSVSYNINAAIKKKYITGFQTVMDPSKLGLINVIVLYDFLNFDRLMINEIKTYIKNDTYVTTVEDLLHGADLLVEYCVPNLSLFNKENNSFLNKYKNHLKIIDIFPVIVKHLYNKKYYYKNKDVEDMIISGDREVITLNDSQKKILKVLNINPKISIIEIFKKTKISPKTIIKIKKDLEKDNFIQRYTIIQNHHSMGINREHFFIDLESNDQNEMRKFVNFSRVHKNIVSVIKLIGRYDLMITVENLDGNHDLFNEIRREFKIEDYKIIRSKMQLRRISIPIIFFE
jgi:DNA-binding Lrp family transcriptional regulator